MSMVETRRVAALLRVKTGKLGNLTTLDLADAIGRGLPVDTSTACALNSRPVIPH